MILLGWIWIGSFTYAGVVAFLLGNGSSAFYDFVQFVAPLFAGLWLSSIGQPTVTMFNRFSSLMLVLGTIVAAYGIFQWLAPPPWDVYWLQHVARDSGMDSTGLARPFELHVFSVLNSATPCAIFLAIAIALNLPRLKKGSILPALGLFVCVIALSLTLVRSAWIALAVGVVLYCLLSSNPWRTASATLVLSAVVLAFFAGVSPWLDSHAGKNSIVLRFQTFYHLNSDASVNARQGTTSELLSEAAEYPTGEGLGIAGTASQLTSFNERVYSIDGGFQARLVEMGFAGFAGYAATLLLAFSFGWAMWWKARQSGDLGRNDVMGALLAVQAMLIVLDFSLDSHNNLLGALFWVVVGIGCSPQNAVAARRATEKTLKYSAGAAR